MPLSNFERMIQLADDVFATRQDINQLDINEDVLDHLRNIHPACVSGYEEGDGPLAWLLLIPTTKALMNQFLEKEISERQLYDLTPVGAPYESLYLCSALVLEEHRGKGIMKQLLFQSVQRIRQDHSIQALFVWPFSKEGSGLAQALAKEQSLPLYSRTP